VIHLESDLCPLFSLPATKSYNMVWDILRTRRRWLFRSMYIVDLLDLVGLEAYGLEK